MSKQTPKFTKNDVRKRISTFLAVHTPRSTKEVVEHVQEAYKIGSSSVRRYLKEMSTAGTVVEDDVIIKGTKRYTKRWGAPLPPAAETEDVQEKTVEDGVPTENKTTQEETVLPDHLKVVDSELQWPVEEELTLDESDIDTPATVAEIPVKSVRTIGTRKNKTRTECVIAVMALTESTPSSIIEQSNQMYVANGGNDDIRKQTQVYKIVAGSLLMLQHATIDLLGTFRLL